jgi:hypothetical protein
MFRSFSFRIMHQDPFCISLLTRSLKQKRICHLWAIKAELVHGRTIHNSFLQTSQRVLCRYSSYRCVVLQVITELRRTGSSNTISSNLHCCVGVCQQAINTAMNNTFAVTATQSLSLLFNCRLTSISLLTAKSPDEVSCYPLLVFCDVICSAT